jgi:uncharacterized protein YunC (DUF1805 family)
VEEDLQTVVHDGPRGRIVACDSAYHADDRNRDRDVVVNASYTGVLPARFIASHHPRGAIGMDCAIGPEGAGIAGLWFFEALEIPAATVDVMTVELGNGVDVYEHGVVSRLNQPARDCGVEVGMSAREAARFLLENDPTPSAPDEITNRTVVETAPDGRQVVCTDSIAFGLPEDHDRNVLCTAGHTGRSAVPYLRKVHPWGFICSDGGGGRDDSGMAGIYIVEEDGLAGATVDARTARMGDGLSTWTDGTISAANVHARRRGVEVGMPAREAAHLLLQPEESS